MRELYPSLSFPDLYFLAGSSRLRWFEPDTPSARSKERPFLCPKKGCSSVLDTDFVYHTSKDVSVAIQPRYMEQALNVIVEYVQKKDAEVL